MYRGIAIVGGNGSGKTSLGKTLADMLGYKHMDIEDYYFKESAIPYADSRTREEVLALLLADIRKHRQFIISSVNCDFGDIINAMYDCIIYIKVPLEVRLNRIEQRGVNKFGNRVLEGGDMYEQEQEFYHFVASRTMEKTDIWLHSMKCPIICIDGTEPIAKNAKFILENF